MSRVAHVGNSRVGNPIRSYIKSGGGSDVSHAVLCGVPNHGVYDWDDGLGNEFNGRGPFLRRLNEGDSEVTPGTSLSPDRKSTRLNSSHRCSSYAVFCLKKKI